MPQFDASNRGVLTKFLYEHLPSCHLLTCLSGFKVCSQSKKIHDQERMCQISCSLPIPKKHHASVMHLLVGSTRLFCMRCLLLSERSSCVHSWIFKMCDFKKHYRLRPLTNLLHQYNPIPFWVCSTDSGSHLKRPFSLPTLKEQMNSFIVSRICSRPEIVIPCQAYINSSNNVVADGANDNGWTLFLPVHIAVW